MTVSDPHAAASWRPETSLDGRSLTALFSPRTVALIGASNRPGKWGFQLARSLLKSEVQRPVYLVNHGEREILGRRAYGAVGDLPVAPDLVILAVPEGALEAEVDAALRTGAKALIVITAGLAERGEDGRALERRLVSRVRRAGAVLLGPNCMGLYDADAGLEAGAWADFPTGRVALVSQSGNVASEIALRLRDAGLGFSRLVSLGNQADLGAADILNALVDHAATDVVALYLEDFGDGRAFIEAARRLAATAKPVVLLAPGASPVGSRAARTHTAALATDPTVIDAACRDARAIRVSTPHELVNAVQALHGAHRLEGRRLGLIGDGGGTNVIAADLLARAHLEVVRFSPELQAILSEHLPPTAGVENPVDLAGGTTDVTLFERVTRAVLSSGEVDGVLLTGFFGGYGDASPSIRLEENAAAAAIAEAVDASAVPLVAHLAHDRSEVARILRARGIPMYGDIAAATDAMRVLSLARAAGRRAEPSWVRARADPRVRARAANGDTSYWCARAILADAHVPLVDSHRVSGIDEALAAARSIAGPVVLKAIVPGHSHKSDAGAVELDLRGDTAFGEAFARMTALFGPVEMAVERFAPLQEGVELIVGVRVDPRFGQIVAVGAGGIYAEVHGDVAVGLGPVDAVEARRMIFALKLAPLLTGTRGRPALAIDAAAAAVASMSAITGQFQELEINPLLVTRSEVVGLDARMIGS